MSEPEKPGKSYTAHITGGVSGQFIQGDGNIQVHTAGADRATEADLSEVRRMIEELKARVEAEAPPEKKAEALQQVQDLQETIESKGEDTADVPDRLGGIKSWFKRNLPALAGAVVSVIVNPIVGKVVEAAGTGLAAEVQRRFGIEEKK
jgi:hypothetical protein